MKKILLLLLLIGFGSAHASIIAVNSLGSGFADDDECTLAEAIVASRINAPVWGCSAGNGDDAIWFDLDHLGPGPHEIVLGGSSFEMTNSISGRLVIEGPGMDQLTIKLAQPTTSEYYFKVLGDQGIWVSFLTIEGFSKDVGDDFVLFDLDGADSAKFEEVRFKNNKGNLIEFNGLATGDLDILGSEFIENETSDILIESVIKGTENQSMTIKDSLFLKNSVGRWLLDVSNANELNRGRFTLTDSQFIENAYNAPPGFLPTNTLVRLYKVQGTIKRNYFYRNEVVSYSTTFPESKWDWGLVVFVASGGIFEHNYLMENSGWNDVRVSLPSSPLYLGFVTHVNIINNTFYNSAKYAVFASAPPESSGPYATAVLYRNAIHGSLSGCGVDPTYNRVEWDFASGNRQSRGDSCVLDPVHGNMDLMFMQPGFYGDEFYLAKPDHRSPLVDFISNNYCSSQVDLYGFVGAADGDADGEARCDIGAIEMPDSEILTVGYTGDDAGDVHMSRYANEGYEMACEGPDDCLWPLPIGQTFTIYANATVGGEFQGWSGSDCNHTGQACDITMDGSNETANAEFEQVDPIATVTVYKHSIPMLPGSINGNVRSSDNTISCSGSSFNNCEGDFLVGQEMVLEASPWSGAVVDHWMGCDTVSVDLLTCTFTLGSQGRTVDVYFDEAPEDLIFQNGFDNP